MYDTIHLKLDMGTCENVNFLDVARKYLEPETININTGLYGEYVSGKIGGLKVNATKSRLKITEGSLCKWHLGDNYQTMGRADTELAIERLADVLHLPMNKAEITRLDLATNLIMNYPPNVYLKHLGELKFTERLIQPNSLYYQGASGVLCFYDKNKESKGNVPELYRERNVLRYEQRYTRQLHKAFQTQAVTAEMLFNEAFYIGLVKRWREAYEQVQKVNDIRLNFRAMKGVKELKQMGLRCLITEVGGQTEMLSLIKEAQQRGEIDRKQALDMKKAILEAVSLEEGIVVPNDAITELTKKIREATKYYR
ncbi:MAG: hypothetical protein IKT74_05730 [Bacteroidales bacterium]|nr:hypothetical protein [Bacteroidales bacterium]